MKNVNKKHKIIALVCICGIIGSLATWTLQKAKQSNQVYLCTSNLQDLGESLLYFANGHQGHYPDRLSDLLIDQPDLSSTLFVVPWKPIPLASGTTATERAERLPAYCSYVYLGAGRSIHDFSSRDLLMFSADGSGPISGEFCLYGDGHVEVDSDAFLIQSILSTRLRTAPPATVPTSKWGIQR